MKITPNLELLRFVVYQRGGQARPLHYTCNLSHNWQNTPFDVTSRLNFHSSPGTSYNA